MTVPLFGKLRTAFLERPVPDAVFELGPDRLTGLRVAARTRTARGRFVLPFRSGALAPSFDRPNVADFSVLGEAIEHGKDALGLGGGTASLLIPEPCVKIFVLSVESVPVSPGERDSFVRWRVGKQMPLLPDDLRLAYDIPAGGSAKKIIVAAAREAVIREYEGLFEAAGMRPGTVTVPSLSLINLVGGATGLNGVLLNVDTDSLSFLAVMDSEWSLYRHKGIASGLPAGEKVALIVKEVENTVHFIEDKERKRVEKIWVRTGSWDDGPGIVSKLSAGLPLSAELVDYDAPADWDAGEKALLAPLVGQIA
jgi:hypothetical protein